MTNYRPELDGIRAIAIVLVLVNHVWLPWDYSGVAGWYGVTLFFGLSGYLITGILQRERAETGTISLRRFYLRRAARLGPALVVMLAFVAVMGMGGAYGPTWWVGIVSSLTYTSNWLDVMGASLGPLSHTWTLAVEEQFYLVWPVVLLAWPRKAGRVAVAVIVAGLVTYAVLPFATAVHTTQACAVALMVGALLAMRGVGSSRLGFLAALAPIGKRAYSLYLWNWPMTVLFGPVGGLVGTIIAAELSYRSVERPIVQWARMRTDVTLRPSTQSTSTP